MAVLALNTTMRPGEIQRLRWRDVNFIDPSLVVREGTTDARVLVISLNADAHAAIIRTA